MFKDYGFTEWNDIVNLLDAETGKYVKSSSHRLIKHREFLILADLCHSERNEESLFLKEGDITIETPFGILFFDEADAIKADFDNVIYIDREKLTFPLELRVWRAGDVFYPFGMKGKKKLSKYLKDEKLSIVEKENTWVLTSNTEIIWVVGKRGDDRFRVTEDTKQILKIKLS